MLRRAVPAMQRLSLDGPAGAQVAAGGRTFAVLPASGLVPAVAQPLALRVTADGYEPLETTVLLNAGRVELELQASRRAPARASTTTRTRTEREPAAPAPEPTPEPAQPENPFERARIRVTGQ